MVSVPPVKLQGVLSRVLLSLASKSKCSNQPPILSYTQTNPTKLKLPPSSMAVSAIFTFNLTFTQKHIMKTIIFLLFTLNFLFLFTYFLRHPAPVNIHLHLHHHHLSTTTTTATVKPWPTLPSLLPWAPPSSTVGSCEGFFGNGFNTTVDFIGSGSGSGWFRCHYSSTLRSSVCEGGRVMMDPNRIRMSPGGERIEDVIGRNDDEELPVFDNGAFRVLVKEARTPTRTRKRFDGWNRVVSKEMLDRYVPRGEILKHTMRELFGSMEVVQQSDQFNCSQWIEEPTLFVTRYEYANVFHTHTDWYSAYVSSRVTGLPVRPNVVFVDGHCKTQLEETWEALFSDVRFAKNFSRPVCFRHAVFVPLGYETAWFKGLTESIDCHGASAQALCANPDDQKTARLSEFGEMIKAAFGFPLERQRLPKPSLEHNVLFVRREDYLAHPRHGGKVESRLSNEHEVFASLKSWASKYTQCRVNLINGVFAHMPMKEQIQAIQDASVIIGAHGAGLTHMVSALPGTEILEIISSQYQRPHFQLISQWKGLKYHAINLPATAADPNEVIRQLKRILKSIGC